LLNDSSKARVLTKHRLGRCTRRFALRHQRIPAAVLALVFSVCAAITMHAQSAEPSEYAVKAAFLFHFAQFVEWPEGAFQEADSPLVYCTIGEDPFQGALEASFKGKMIGSHSLQVKHLKEAGAAQGCHVAFLGKAAGRHIQDELAGLRGNPVLTVGETEQFVNDSGMIGFSLEENKIRFDINLEAAEKAKLKISARLLALARTVIGGPKRN
jgi:hypothetical protein